MGWEPEPDKQAMFGYGNYDLAMATLEKALTGKTFIAGDRFTAADLFVGAYVNFMTEEEVDRVAAAYGSNSSCRPGLHPSAIRSADN